MQLIQNFFSIIVLLYQVRRKEISLSEQQIQTPKFNCFPWQQDTLYDNTNLIWGFNPICPILFTSYINRYIRLALKTWLTFSLFREKNSRHLKRDITSLSLYSNVSLSEHDEHLRLMASQPHSQANIEKAILFQLNLNWIQLEKEMYHNWEFVE